MTTTPPRRVSVPNRAAAAGVRPLRFAAATDRPRREEAWAFPAVVFFGSRVIFLVAGILAARFIQPAVPATSVLEPPGALHEWAHWDGAWYVGIAAHGYEHFMPPLATNFFPLFPLTVSVPLKLFGGPAFWGVVISLAAGAIALQFVYAIADRLWGRRCAQASILALAFFPTSFFLNAVYTESLFLALTAGSLWALIVRRNFLLAGLLGGFATATRHVALFLLLALGLEWFRNRKEVGWRGLAGLALVPSGLAVYALYLWHAFGHPLEFKKAAADPQWRRTLANPLDTMSEAWHDAGDGLTYAAHPLRVFEGTAPGPAIVLAGVIGLVALVLCVVLVVLGVRLLPLSLWLYGTALVAFPVVYASGNFALFGFQRYILVAFPLFFVLGSVLARSRLALVVWLAASTIVGVYLTALFTTWRWVA